tara:strand:- start:125896 stop:126984 length:1089 start_codon:yes stop_codon:yes gene_type:complete
MPIKFLKHTINICAYIICLQVVVSQFDWINWDKKAKSENKCKDLKSLVKKSEEIFNTKAEFVARFDGEECKSKRTDTPMYLASVSKHLTAFAINNLIEEKVITREDKICKLLEFENCNKFTGSISVEELLTHTSGLGRISDSWWKDLMIHRLFLYRSPETQVDDILTQSQRHKIGTFVYSNSGYRLLAFFVDRYLKEKNLTWEAYFEKKGLNSFTLSTKQSPYLAGQANFAFPLYPKKYFSINGNGPFFEGTNSFGSGNYITSAKSLYDWQNKNVAFLLDRGEGDGFKKYYNGIVESEVDGQRILWHNGATSFSQTLFMMNRKSRDQLVILFNSNSLDDSRKKVTKEIRNLFSNKEYLEPID